MADDVAKWIRFILAGQKAKTAIWSVITKDGVQLGKVLWFGRWRGYAFFPDANCVFEPTCLRDIATFVECKTKEHRTNRAAQKLIGMNVRSLPLSTEV